MSRIAYYGGSFNPVHQGHIRTAAHALHELGLDRICFMPNAVPPHKNALCLDYDTRVKLLSLALEDAGDARLEISTVEQDPDMKHYTHGTLTRLRELHKGADLFFIMGMDSLMQLDTWKNWDQLVSLASIAVLTRSGIRLVDLPDPVFDHVEQVNTQYYHGQRSTSFIFMKNVEVDVSSTVLRELLSIPESELSELQQELLRNALSPRELQAIRELGLFAPAAV